MLAPPSPRRVGAPSSGKSWIRHWYVLQFFLKKYKQYKNANFANFVYYGKVDCFRIITYPTIFNTLLMFAIKVCRSEIIANVSSDMPFCNNRWANVLYLSLSFMWLILSCSFCRSSSAAFSCCFPSSSACLLAASSLASLSLLLLPSWPVKSKICLKFVC